MKGLIGELWLPWLYGASALALGFLLAWLGTRAVWRSRLARDDARWQRKLEAADDHWSTRLQSAGAELQLQLDKRVAEIKELKREVVSGRARVRGLREDLEGAERDGAKKDDRLESLHARVTLMDARLAKALETSDGLAVEIANVRADLSDTERALDEALAALDASKRRARALTGQVGRREARIRKLEPLEHELREREEEIAVLQGEWENEHAQMEHELARLRARISEIASLEERVRDRERKIADLDSELGERDTQLLEHRVALAGLKLLPDQLRERDMRIAALEEEVAELERFRTTAREHEGCAARLAGRDQEIEALRGQIAAAESAVPDPSSARRGLSLTTFEPSPAQPLHATQASRTMFAFAPADKDDLKQIRGIGPVLERTLNRLGVTRFEEIASWDAAAIDRVAQQLRGFRERIYRDEWVRQARELHQRTRRSSERSHGRAS